MTARISIHILDLSRGERLAELATLLQLNYMLLIIDDTFNSLKTEGKSDVTLSYNNIYPHAKKYFLPLLYLPPPPLLSPPSPLSLPLPRDRPEAGWAESLSVFAGLCLVYAGEDEEEAWPGGSPLLEPTKPEYDRSLVLLHHLQYRFLLGIFRWQ